MDAVQEMDINTRLYCQSAKALGLPVQLLPDIAGFEVALGAHRYHFRGGDTPFNRGCAVGIASNKYCAKYLLSRAGFPTPKAQTIARYKYSQACVQHIMQVLRFPVVIKPTVGTALGTDVICNVTELDELNRHLVNAFERHEYLSIEEFHADLNSYRVLVFYNKIIGVVQRFSARIIGDGVHSIEELIAITNQTRDIQSKAVTLNPIRIDEESLIRLRELSMTAQSIPRQHEEIILCYTCNASRGGTMKSLGKKIGADNARLLRRAARVLGLNFVGFDVNCHDLSVPIEQSNGVIIEANYNPDVSIHEKPLMGIPNQVSKIILRKLIFKHPFAYLVHMFQTRRAMYLKFFMIMTACFSYKLFS